MSDRTFRLSTSDIDNAFERNEFRVVFQPKIDLASERVTGAEVFVRWQHPQYGLLPPGLFLDFIEANGRMPDLTGFVFHAALDGCKRWKAQGKDWTVSINVAPGTVTSEGFSEGLARLLQEYGLEPARIIIEDGAYFKGSIDILKPGQKPELPRLAAAAPAKPSAQSALHMTAEPRP